jgi:phosphonate transport system substrate-binding protein
MRKHIRTAGVVGLAAASVFVVAGCGKDKAKTAADSAACPNGKIRMAIEPYEDAAKLTPAYQALAKGIQDGMGCPVDFKVVSDYPAEVLAMQNGQLDVAEFGPLGYVFADQNANAEAIASFATADGKLSTYTAGIWVPKGSKITSIADLKGKTLALSSAGSTSGDALPRQAMLDAGLKPGDVKVEYAGGHPQSLLALTNGKVDAGEVNSQEQASATAEGKFDAAKYTEIWKSGDIPNDPITVYGKLPQAFKDKLQQVLLNLPASTLTQIAQYLEFEPAGKMLAVTKTTYQPLFDLAAKLHLTQKDV